VLILLLALALRLPFMTTTGYDADVRMYETWSWKATTLGIHTAYDPSAGRNFRQPSGHPLPVQGDRLGIPAPLSIRSFPFRS